MYMYEEYQLIKANIGLKIKKTDPLFKFLRIIWVLLYGIIIDIFCFVVMLIGRFATGKNMSFEDIRKHNIKSYSKK